MEGIDGINGHVDLRIKVVQAGWLEIDESRHPGELGRHTSRRVGRHTERDRQVAKRH